MYHAIIAMTSLVHFRLAAKFHLQRNVFVALKRLTYDIVRLYLTKARADPMQISTSRNVRNTRCWQYV